MTVSQGRPLIITAKPSWVLRGFLLTTHLSAVFTLSLLDLPLHQLVTLAMLVCLSLFYYLRKLARADRDMRLEWRSGRGWILHTRSGWSGHVKVIPNSLVWRYLLILHIESADSDSKTLLLAADAVDKNVLRRTRQILKINDQWGV